MGDSAVAAVGVLLGLYESFLFAQKRAHGEHRWLAAVCFASAAYAMAIAVHYNSGPETSLVLSRLEGLALVLMLHAVVAFLGETTERWLLPPKAVLASAVLTAALIVSPWIITRVEPVEMAWLGRPFWRRPQTVAVDLLLAYGLLLVAGAGRALVLARKRFPIEARYFGIGVALWFLTTLYTFVFGIMRWTLPFSVVEYGFVAFAASLVARDARRYMALLASSERDATTARSDQRQAEALYETLIESLPEPVAVIQDDRFDYANPALREALGYPAAPSPIEVAPVAMVHPDDRDRAAAVLRGETVELRVLTRNGAVRNAVVRTVPVALASGPAVLLFARDVTAERQLTARMMDIDRMVAVGTLAAGVGHEINNPLASMICGVQEVRDRLADDDDADRAELLEALADALASAIRIRDIVDALHGFTRSDEEARAVPMERAVASAVSMAAAEINVRARLVVEHAKTRPVLANEARLAQVLLNLIVNACHAIDPDKPSENTITVRTYMDGAEVVCEVADTGRGIDPENAKRVFDAFFTTKPVGQGTGLGLSVSRETVRALGGSITFTSEPGHGTVFRVRLPGCEEGSGGEGDRALAMTRT